MSDLTELFSVNSEQALRFFAESLREEVLPVGVTGDEFLYVASVLAHYAQTPRYRSDSFLADNMSDLFEQFVLGGMTNEKSLVSTNPEILEVAGSQTLLFVGFFRDQTRRRHNVAWYDRMGQLFYSEAGSRSLSRKRKEMLGQIADHFPSWAVTCRNMSRTLRDNRYLLFLQ